MYKLKYKVVAVASSLALLCTIPFTSFAAKGNTTDDLRVLMNMNRLTDETSIIEIQRLLSICYKQQQWNDLVAGLNDIDTTHLSEFEEKEIAWSEAKNTLLSDFANNEPIDIILSDLSEYNTANSVRLEYTASNSVDLSFIDTSDIEAQLDYANSVLDGIDDSTNIGVIGADMQTFTKANLLVKVPFGRSYSYDTGMLQVNDGLTVSISKGHEIYSQFNGEVVSVTDTSVIIKTGKSIEIEYLNIKPSVTVNQKISQYTPIGSTIYQSMTVKIKLNTVYIDPLLLYGSRSSKWYQNWAISNPGCTIEASDYSMLLDCLPDEALSVSTETSSAGSMTFEDGTVSSIVIQGNNFYTDTPDNITLDKTSPSIIIDDSSNE